MIPCGTFCAMKMLVLVVGRLEILSAGQFASQFLRLVDHHWQALRAEMVGAAAIIQRQQGDFIGIAATVQAGFFSHGSSPLG